MLDPYGASHLAGVVFAQAPTGGGGGNVPWALITALLAALSAVTAGLTTLTKYIVKKADERADRKDDELRQEHLWLRDRGVPVLEAATAAVTESNKTMLELARMVQDHSRALSDNNYLLRKVDRLLDSLERGDHDRGRRNG